MDVGATVWSFSRCLIFSRCHGAWTSDREQRRHAQRRPDKETQHKWCMGVCNKRKHAFAITQFVKLPVRTNTRLATSILLHIKTQSVPMYTTLGIDWVRHTPLKQRRAVSNRQRRHGADMRYHASAVRRQNCACCLHMPNCTCRPWAATLNKYVYLVQQKYT